MGVGWGSTAVTDMGAFVRCSCNSSTPNVSIGGAVWPIPEPGRDIRACWAAGHVYVAMKGQETGRCLVVRDDGLQVKLGTTYGNQCVGIMPWMDHVMAVYVTNSIQWVQCELDLDLAHWLDHILPLPTEIVGTSQGFLDLSAAGQPLWTDLYRTIVLPNGVELVLWMTRENYTIGQGLVSPSQVSAYDGVNMYTVWEGDTSFPPQLAVFNGTPVAAIASGTAVFVDAPFGPYIIVPPVPPDPPIPPEPPVPPIPPEPHVLKIGDIVQFRLADTSDTWNVGTLAKHNDGTPYVALAVTSWFGIPVVGTAYASLTPGGTWQNPQTNPAGWEQFTPDPGGGLIMAAPRNGGQGGVLTVANCAGKLP